MRSISLSGLVKYTPHFSAYYEATKPETLSTQELNEKDQQLKTWFNKNKTGDVAYISLPEAEKLKSAIKSL